jgi:D-glycero-alpha-D-manno-heptose-7-phosphate kinase
MYGTSGIRSKAPLRISFGGGGTDIPPYPEERGGVTLNTTINKYAYVTLIPRTDKRLNVESLDHDMVASYGVEDDFTYDSRLDIVKAAIRVMKVKGGLDIFLHSDARPGTGLGSSSAQIISVVGALKHWLKSPLTDYDIAELGYRIENDELGNHSGRQDQYSATFGGFNLTEFHSDTTIVNPLRVKDDILNELEYRLLLCYTGKVRVSAGIIDDHVSRYVQKKEDMVRALDETKALAYAMKNALLLGRVDELGSLLHEAWRCKKMFSSKIADPQIDKFYEVARQNGAIGGKLLGAGGGGCFLLLCQFDKKHIVARKLEEIGGRIIDFTFDFQGLQTWEVK